MMLDGSGNGAANEPNGAVGGGLEQFLGSGWSVKAEYLYLNLGSEIVSGVSSNGVALNSTTINSKFNIVRAGLNYQF